jgi:hypothetical protein
MRRVFPDDLLDRSFPARAHLDAIATCASTPTVQTLASMSAVDVQKRREGSRSKVHLASTLPAKSSIWPRSTAESTYIEMTRIARHRDFGHRLPKYWTETREVYDARAGRALSAHGIGLFGEYPTRWTRKASRVGYLRKFAARLRQHLDCVGHAAVDSIPASLHLHQLKTGNSNKRLERVSHDVKG